jgi:HEAT repeats
LMRLGGINALGEIGPAAQDAVNVLIDRLKDPQPLVRSAAALSLGKIGPHSAFKAILPLKDQRGDEKEPAVRVSIALALVQLQPNYLPAMKDLAKEAGKLITSTNQGVLKSLMDSAIRPRTPLEMQRQAKIQGVLNFFVSRNSHRFGDGLDKWSHAVMNQLGPEAIPAMVDTLNLELAAGGPEGFVVNGMPVWKQPKPGPCSVFFK